MPLYEYACEACGSRTELLQKFSDPPPASCPACGKGPLIRLLSSPAIQFKGSGWYITDYARKDKGGAGSGAKPASGGSAPSEASGDSTASGTGDSNASSTPPPAAPSSDAKT